MKKMLLVILIILVLGIISGISIGLFSSKTEKIVKTKVVMTPTQKVHEPPTINLTPPVSETKIPTVHDTKTPTKNPPTVHDTSTPTKPPTITVKANRACIGSSIADFEKKYGKSEHSLSYEFYRFHNDNFVAMEVAGKVHYVNISYDVITRTADFEDALKKTIRFLPTDASLFVSTKSEEGRQYYFKSKTLQQNDVLFNGFAIVVINANEDGIYSSYVAAGEKP